MTSFKWGTVTAISPVRVQLDGPDTTAIPVTLDALVDSGSLAVDDRVRVELAGSKRIVHGRLGGVPGYDDSVLSGRVTVNEGDIAALEDVHLQLDTTNSVAKMVTQYGIGKLNGGDTRWPSETFTFPVAFASVPIVHVSYMGARAAGAFNTVGVGEYSGDSFARFYGASTTGATAGMARANGVALSASWDFYYSWSATGVLA